MTSNKLTSFLASHIPELVLFVVILVLTLVPALEMVTLLQGKWQGIVPAFGDESLYNARIQTLVHGHTGGNPFFLEHSDGPPLVIFGGVWLNAIPFLVGFSFTVGTFVNFVLWSLLFAIAAYVLFRELRAPPWIAATGTLLVYIQSYAHVWRPANLQPVYPFYFLFYFAFARFIRNQNKQTIIGLGLATGATFYLFAYLWQIAVITLGLLFLYALARRQWPLVKATLIASGIGGLIGLPVPLYMLWLSRSSPYYWESMGRLGLVNTHLPMAEIVYSGGWIGIVCATLGLLLWRVRSLREDPWFADLSVFLLTSGFAIWIMQGSNLITGKLLETGEHIRILLLPWLLFSIITIGVALWQRRTELSRQMVALVVLVGVVLTGVNLYFINEYIQPFLPSGIDVTAWQTQEQYAGPFTWLTEHESEPVVVWSAPEDYLSTALPIFTKHFTLYTYWGMLELLPSSEVRERYLITQYFNNPTLADLKSGEAMALYLGRADYPHRAKTIEREVKICKMLFFWDRQRCGSAPTPTELLGEQFFTTLETTFQKDIKTHIKTYLAKYHVAYIVKDKVLDPQYHPEALGAVRVYADERFEIYDIAPTYE